MDAAVTWFYQLHLIGKVILMLMLTPVIIFLVGALLNMEHLLDGHRGPAVWLKVSERLEETARIGLFASVLLGLIFGSAIVLDRALRWAGVDAVWTWPVSFVLGLSVVFGGIAFRLKRCDKTRKREVRHKDSHQ
jgi:predicted phage tail protein